MFKKPKSTHNRVETHRDSKNQNTISKTATIACIKETATNRFYQQTKIG